MFHDSCCLLLTSIASKHSSKEISYVVMIGVLNVAFEPLVFSLFIRQYSACVVQKQQIDLVKYKVCQFDWKTIESENAAGNAGLRMSLFSIDRLRS